MLFRCNQCGRTHGEKRTESEGVNTQFCAKCYGAFYKDDMTDLRDIFKGIIREEQLGHVVWEGEEKIYSDSDLAVYNEVLAEVIVEKEGSGEQRR